MSLDFNVMSCFVKLQVKLCQNYNLKNVNKL